LGSLEISGNPLQSTSDDNRFLGGTMTAPKDIQSVLDRKYGRYYEIADAISILLHPFAEVVLHDTETGKVVRIWNALSRRKEGSLSHLEDAPDLFTNEKILGPYEKALPDGGRCKSITVELRDGKAHMGFFCINMNVSFLESTKTLIESFITAKSHRPEPIYRNDVQEHINYLIRDYLLTIRKTAASLSRDERLAFVGLVNERGLFQTRNSMLIVAKALNISRSGVYTLLREVNGRVKRRPVN
jgi:predicted transcriptional regulator YheO